MACNAQYIAAVLVAILGASCSAGAGAGGEQVAQHKTPLQEPLGAQV